MQADHAVLHSDAVNKRLLVVQEVSVGDPQLVGDPVVQGQVERDPEVGETLVPPVLLEVHGQRVVLGDTGEKHGSELWLQMLPQKDDVSPQLFSAVNSLCL